MKISAIAGPKGDQQATTIEKSDFNFEGPMVISMILTAVKGFVDLLMTAGMVVRSIDLNDFFGVMLAVTAGLNFCFDVFFPFYVEQQKKLGNAGWSFNTKAFYGLSLVATILTAVSSYLVLNHMAPAQIVWMPVVNLVLALVAFIVYARDR